MRVFNDLESVTLRAPCTVVTVGIFDGVHLGHQQIIAEARSLADGRGCEAFVVTLDPHPAAALGGEAPSILTPLDEKMRRMEACGVDACVVLDSRSGVLALSPEQFVEQILVDVLRPGAVVEGASFRFGREAAGDLGLLRELGGRHGFDVVETSPVRCAIPGPGEVTVSSSLVRSLIGEGDVEAAATCLGRAYVLQGRVISGYGVGRHLGIPTANVGETVQLVPADGIYVARAHVGEASYAAAISVGGAPTFGRSDRQIEAHLIDFEGDLYGRAIAVEFLERIRPSQKFDSAESLVAQVQRDVAYVRRRVATSAKGAS